MIISHPSPEASPSTMTAAYPSQETLSPPINESRPHAQTAMPMSMTWMILRAIMLFGSLFVLTYQSIVVLHLPSSQQHTIQLITHAVAAVGVVRCFGKGVIYGTKVFQR